jgi:TonB family protein
MPRGKGVPRQDNLHKKPGGIKTSRVVLGIVVFLIIFAIVGGWEPSKPTVSKPSSLSSNSRNRSSATTQDYIVPAPGTSRVLSTPEIRYCLAEDIRLETMRGQLGMNESTEIEKFNSLVKSFNSRCVGYRYSTQDMISAREFVEARKELLKREGLARIQGWRTRATTQPPPAPRPNQMVLEVQQILKSLGYETGPVDGLIGSKTTAAVKKFQMDYRHNVDGIIDQELYQQADEVRLRRKSSNHESTSPSNNEQTSSFLIRDVEEGLKNLGYRVGSVDGVPDEKTKTAVRQFQHDNDIFADGEISEKLLDQIFATARAKTLSSSSAMRPTYRPSPTYPKRALKLGIEGECVVEFTVTSRGKVTSASVINDQCKEKIFRRPSIEAVKKFKFEPRVVNGMAVDVPGVRTKFVYELAD